MNTNNQEQKEVDRGNFADIPLSPPSLISLVSSLASQVMVSLGYYPNPLTKQTMFLLNQGKHLIDTVQLLYDKTEGNRTDLETKTFQSVLHELQMLYVAATEEKARRENNLNGTDCSECL